MIADLLLLGNTWLQAAESGIDRLCLGLLIRFLFLRYNFLIMPVSSGGNSSNSDSFFANGLYFSCKRCSVCCRYDEGFVFLTENDIDSLKTTLKINSKEFLEIYCRWIPMGDGKNNLSLKEKSNYDCIFWQGDGCLVYQARPIQCRAFPFWQSVLNDEKSWKTAARDCPGMNSGALHSNEAIKNWLAIRNKEPIISRSASYFEARVSE